MNLSILAVTLCVVAYGVPPACAHEQEPVSAYEEEFSVPEGISPIPAARVSDLQGPAWHSMITNIPGDWFRAGQVTFRTKSLPTLVGIALITGALMVVDHETYNESHTLMRNSETIHDASHVILHFGDGKASFGLAAAFALYGIAGDDRRALRTASQTVEAVIASGIAVQLLKRVTGRESPQMATVRHGEWRPFPAWGTYNRHQPRYYAFPSGHMTTAIATITVVAENYPEVRWIRPVGYVLAALMGASLVNVGWHWYSDFPLAIAMGYSFGMIASHREDDDPMGEGGISGPAGLRILPGVNADGLGVTLALCF